jgi:anti-sigma factor RsiW
VTRPRGCADLRLELGVYVLNAIAPADRRALELHLAQCAGCRQELAGLAALPGLLGTVSVGEAVRATSEAGLAGLRVPEATGRIPTARRNRRDLTCSPGARVPGCCRQRPGHVKESAVADTSFAASP